MYTHQTNYTQALQEYTPRTQKRVLETIETQIIYRKTQEITRKGRKVVLGHFNPPFVI